MSVCNGVNDFMDWTIFSRKVKFSKPYVELLVLFEYLYKISVSVMNIQFMAFKMLEYLSKTCLYVKNGENFDLS